ncbi:endolytic transglycosylase MltG [uncultured Microbacterium sp.]|uniref:endolytic transglycosylase MltG n=1 Tax=uncultured Microbacterium sp. TaxID=191216 RepID=UPI002609824B|nr:endolytic transglycosylase MltG [uncultured Microbacterium sp.]
MPERETPDHDPNSLSDDLFANLPEPSHQVPSVDSTPPPPGSRRARREAAAASPRQNTDAPTTPVSAPMADEPPIGQGSPVAPAAEGIAVSATPEPTPAPIVGSSLDDLFVAETSHEDRAPRKKKRRVGCFVTLGILLVLIGGAVYGGIWVMNTYGDQIDELMGWGEPTDYEPGQATGEATITIREGDTGSPVSTALYEAGVTKTDRVFYNYLVSENIEAPFYPGVYSLQKQMTAAAALEALSDPANRMENTVSIAEGGTVSSALNAISESIGIPSADLDAAVADPRAYGVDTDRLDGWLFPAVYTFDPEVTASEVIQRMVDRTREALSAAGVQAGDENRILTIASIVQREGHTADFDKVSRVIANRLDPSNDQTHGLLQMDSTAQFGYGLTHEGPVASWPWDEVVGDENPWNTYVHAGLPVSPISNPSEAAIQAAQSPADGPWFYFVTVNLDTGETVFSATYAEQQAAEAQYRKWCEENPDGGCY